MTKKEFVDIYAKNAGMSKKDAEMYINLFLGTVEELLCEGKEISFVGWGKWTVSTRKERKGINPTTKEEINIPAKNVVKFKVGKSLADKVGAIPVKKATKKAKKK